MKKPPPPAELPSIMDPFTLHARLDVSAVMDAHDWSAYGPGTVRMVEACMVAAYLRGQLYGHRQAHQEALRRPHARPATK